MSQLDATTVGVVLNMQQMEMLERLCAQHGFSSPAEALRHGLREYLRSGPEEVAR